MAFGDCFRGRSVFLTGHTGFKGAWLSLWLSELGARVHGYSLAPPTNPSLFDEAGVAERLASHSVADVRDGAALAGALFAAKPDFVFHMAAQSLVRRSYREPAETYATNVMGTVNLLEAVRAAGGVRVCQVITSDKCYHNREWVWPYREDDPMGGADPYSSSKGCAELVAAAFRHSFFPPDRIGSHGVSLATARAGNVIGGGDWAEDRIVPDCIRALSTGHAVAVRSPHAIRPWQHVLEPLSGYLSLAARQWAEPEFAAQAWNFGPAAAGHVPVQVLVESVVRAWGRGSWTDASGGASADRLHEARFLKLDITKAMSLLDWRPVYSVDEAVAATVAWYRAHAEGRRGAALRSLCLADIQAYTVRAEAMCLPWAGGTRAT